MLELFGGVRLVEKLSVLCVDQRRPKLVFDLADEVRKERKLAVEEGAEEGAS